MKVLVCRDRNILSMKLCVSLVNLLSQKGFDVFLLGDTYNKTGEDVIGLNPKVQFINLNAKTKNVFLNCYRRVREKCLLPYFRYNKIIKKINPDIIITFFPNDLYRVTRFQNHDVPIIQMIHCYPPSLFYKLQKKKNLVRWLIDKSFKKVTVYQVLLESYKNLIPTEFNTKKVVCIPNFCTFPPKEMIRDLNYETKKIIYIARVEEKVKRPHLLIEAFGKIAKEFPDWTVELWGDSKYPEYEKRLMKLAETYGVENRVFIKGFYPKIIEVYAQADIHAFPSLQEGFGLGLVDGMSMGLPSVGFANTPAINELIIDNYNGFLAKDVDDFSQKLKLLMSDKNLRIQMGKNAVTSVEKYTSDAFADAWEKLILETVQSYKKKG